MSNHAAITEYSKLVAIALDEKEILISSEFDLDFDGAYKNGLFAVSADKICAVTEEKVILVENISNIEKSNILGGGELINQPQLLKKILKVLLMDFLKLLNTRRLVMLQGKRS